MTDSLKNYRIKERITQHGIEYVLEYAQLENGCAIDWVELKGLRPFDTLLAAQLYARQRVKVLNQKYKYHYFKND